VNDITDLTCNITTHSGKCLIVADGNSLTHSGNDMYDVLDALTDACTISGHSVTFPFPEWAAGATKVNVLLGTDASGDMKNVVSLLTTAPSTDKVLAVLKDGTAVSWADADRPAVNESSPYSMDDTYPGTDAGDQLAWTSGGSTGLTMTVQTRTMWNGTYLYGFYRTLKFDRYGRIYSASGETMYPIEQPTVITWS
jgi:hypothetical protein